VSVSETPDARRQVRPGVHHFSPGSSHECSYVEDLAAPFVLAAVEPDERERIERHRRRCPNCTDLIADVRQTVGYLALAVPQVAPPARAKAALFARVEQAERPDFSFPNTIAATLPARTVTIPSSGEALAPIPPGWGEGTLAAPSAIPEKINRTGRFRPNWQLLATPLATVPLVLALGIVGFWGLSTQNRLSARSAEVNQLSQEVDNLSDRVNVLSESLAGVDNFIVAADAKRYDMTANAGASPDAVGQVIANPNTVEALLLVKGLSGAHPTYEVLLESTNGGMVSAGELPVTEDGEGMTVLKLSEPFASYRSVHVKPKLDETGNGVSDSVSRIAPDALTGTIDPNLGGSADTNAPNVGHSN
jgi:hypothetical protein